MLAPVRMLKVLPLWSSLASLAVRSILILAMHPSSFLRSTFEAGTKILSYDDCILGGQSVWSTCFLLFQSWYIWTTGSYLPSLWRLVSRLYVVDPISCWMLVPIPSSSTKNN
jgi:hypothetical protein